VTAADLSRPMLEQARKRLEKVPNVSFAVEDGQALHFPDESFDAVVCGMALMLFPDAALGLKEFLRVMKRGGRAAVSVNTTPERSFVTRVPASIGRYVPSRADAAAKYFSLGDPLHLCALFEAAGFQDVSATKGTWHYGFSSFDAYFEPIERGQGATGVEYAGLPEEVRRAVREDVRRGLERDAGGPIEVEVESCSLVGAAHSRLSMAAR
jgi:SAM-dependent methyltransferase